jgi:hypothetical protein
MGKYDEQICVGKTFLKEDWDGIERIILKLILDK